VGQRLHKQDPVTLEVMAFPLVSTDLDCTDFSVDGGSSQQASLDGGQPLWSSLGSSLADLFLPDPLGAMFRRRPPRGLGGLVGSFSSFFGAVPEDAEAPPGLFSTAYVNNSPDATVSRGQAISVPVTLDMSQLSPEGDLGAAQFELLYDEAFLEFNSTESSLAGILVANGTTPGKVAVAFVHTEAQGTAQLTLVTIHFTVRTDAPSGGSALTLNDTAAPSDTGLNNYPMPLAAGGNMTINP